MRWGRLNKSFRLDVVDALRGFSVMAILLVHSIEHFIFPVYPDSAIQPEWLNILDKGVFSVVFSLFAGKAYAIFAFLFGFTFYIQYSNQERIGKDFGYRFLWRLLLLTLFATVNAAFFPGGDVLLLFSIMGLSLFVVRKFSNKAVLAISVFLLLQPVEWYHYICYTTDLSYQMPDLGVGAMYAEIAENVKSGDWKRFIIGNISVGQKASFVWAIGAGRYAQTIGLFLLGLVVGRKGFFLTSDTNNRFWIGVLILGAVLFAPLYQLKVELMAEGNNETVKNSVGTIMDMWQKLAFTAVLVSSFVLLYNGERFRKLTNNLRFYGKLSLTNYLTQSIIGALIYFPIGLYLAPYCGYTVSLMIGICICILQVQFSKWWIKTHKQGPLESLWHKMTWIKFGKKE